jgi:3-phenylpropionate/trans-cinnamate dioxygenase ferredoxin subunit
MTKYVVGTTAEIPPGERKIVELEGRSIGIFNVDGDFFALLDQCPHAGAALCSFGTVFGVSTATAPDQAIDYQRNRSIRCPWHQWEFDIRTGVSWYDPRNTKVRKYEVEVVPGAPTDAVPGSPEDVVDPNGGRQRGPHVMEGYHVILENDTVIVDTSRRRPGTQRNRRGSPTSATG